MNCIEHSKKIQNDLWDLNEDIQNTVHSLVINVNSRSTDSTNSENEF